MAGIGKQRKVAKEYKFRGRNSVRQGNSGKSSSRRSRSFGGMVHVGAMGEFLCIGAVVGGPVLVWGYVVFGGRAVVGAGVGGVLVGKRNAVG